MTDTDTKDVLIECIHSLFSTNSNPSPEQVAEAVAEGLGLEQEWAVARYDPNGNFSSFVGHDYEFDSVYRAFMQMRENESSESGGLGMVTRFFTHWGKV